MEEKVTGIVVGGVAYGESDKIINIFTVEKGVVSARIKGVKKAGAKLKFASEPFCFAEYILLKSGDKRTVINASLHDSFYPIRENIEKFYCAGVVCEFVRAFFREEILSPELFFTVAKTLEELAYGKHNAQTLCTRFLVGALSLVGYGLNFDGCVQCGSELDGRIYFDYDSGGFYCDDCFNQTGREILVTTYKSIVQIMSGSEVDKESGQKCLKLLAYYLANKTEVTLKSLDELIKL